MHKKIKYLNITLLFLLPPAMALAVKDYLSYRIAPASYQGRSTQAAAAPVEPDIMAYSQIIEAPVFPSKVRKLTAAGMPGPGEGGQAPSVLSQIKLLGTYVGPKSFAVFERAGAQAVFKTGESVFDAGTLKAVLRDRAVISYGLGETAITMEDEPEGLARLQDAESSGAEEPDVAPVAAGTSGGGTSGYGVEKIDENTFALDQKAVASSLGNMNKILSDARMTPRMSNKGIEGFMVTEIKKGGVFDLIGLRNGDVLTRINGYEIDTPEKAMQVLSGLRGETAISLDIVRGGSRQTLSYQVR